MKSKLLCLGDKSGSNSVNFDSARASLKPKEAAFVPTRFNDKWVLVFYMPENSPVHDKMVYASSLSALKLGLQTNNFIGEGFKISDAKECTLSEYTASTREIGETELFTMEEKMKHEAIHSSHVNIDNEQKVTVDLPIRISSESESAIIAFQKQQHGYVSLKLNGDTEYLEVDDTGNGSVEQIAGKLPSIEPRYVLVNFVHDHEGASISAPVFIYYCPDKAKAKLKMFYSASKQIFMKAVEKYNLEIKKSNMECSEVKEVTTSNLLDLLHPKASVVTSFDKPQAKGRGGKRMVGSKFDASK
jgi:hypothetical protein